MSVDDLTEIEWFCETTNGHYREYIPKWIVDGMLKYDTEDPITDEGHEQWSKYIMLGCKHLRWSFRVWWVP